MRKLIGISVLLFCLVSCEKEEYTSYKQEADVANIIDVNLSPNSSVLFGDGEAELTFKVKAFSEVKDTRKVEVKVGDEIIVKDSTFIQYIEINNDRLDQSQLAIYKDDGTKVDYKFTTTENIGDSVAFYAVYKGVKSKIRKVKIIDKPIENFEPIVVPVIFHVLYKKGDAYLFEKINSDYLQKKLDRLNRVFAGKEYPNAPSTIDTKITFELATHDTKGKPLAAKGVEITVLPDDDKINGSTYILNNMKTMIWDLNHYLNLFIHKDANYWGYGVKRPTYILNNGSHLEMDWPKLKVVNTPEEAKYSNYKDVSIEMHQSFLYNSDDLSFAHENRFETHFGLFYGLITTQYMISSGAPTDFCSDTHTYFNRFRRPEKWTFMENATNAERKNGDEIYFDSFNIMDEYSRCSTISYEQALRIRTVVENCPFRMMKKQ